jgi:ribosomal protein L23
MALLQNANKVTVKVAAGANKTEIKESFQRLYQVKVVDVKIINQRAKEKTRGGRIKASSPATRKRSSPLPKAVRSTSSKSKESPLRLYILIKNPL